MILRRKSAAVACRYGSTRLPTCTAVVEGSSVSLSLRWPAALVRDGKMVLVAPSYLPLVSYVNYRCLLGAKTLSFSLTAYRDYQITN